MGGPLAGFTLDLLALLGLLHLTDLGEHNFTEDGTAGNLAQTALLCASSLALSWRGIRFAIGRELREGRRARSLLCHFHRARDVLIILLHLERLNAVRQLDDLDTSAQTRASNVGTDLGQQVAVAGRLTGQPGVLQGFFGGDTLGRIRLQQREDEVLGVLRNIAPVALVEDDLSASALFNQIGQVLGTEGRVSAKQGVGDNTEGPHVDGLAVTLLKHNLWGGVAEGARHAGQNLAGAIQHLGNTEICEDQRRMGVGTEVEKVFGFQV